MICKSLYMVLMIDNRLISLDNESNLSNDIFFDKVIFL